MKKLFLYFFFSTQIVFLFLDFKGEKVQGLRSVTESIRDAFFPSGDELFSTQCNGNYLKGFESVQVGKKRKKKKVLLTSKSSLLK